MTTTTTTFKPGDRVKATLYGKPVTGTVTRHTSPGIVWVRWDRATRDMWHHVESVQRVTQ